jgi:drug/metabolite transporter (DMT)-like permease
MNKRLKQAYIYAGLSVFFWSTVASAFKVALKYVNYDQLLLLSSLISFLFFFIVLLVQKKINPLKSFTPKDYLMSALQGLLNPFLYYLLLFRAYWLLPAQEALTLNYTWAIMVVIFSIPLLKQKIRLLNIIAILISFFGVIVIATHGDVLGLTFSNPLGAILALSSSIFWALYWILNIKDRRDEIVKLFLNFGFGFIFILIFVLITGNISMPSVEGIVSVAYVGLFEMGLTFYFWLKALKLSPTTAQVSNLIYMSPFLSLFFIQLIVGENILASTFIGLVFIIIGIILQQYVSREKNKVIE